jgi:hypothetical protein
VVAASPCASVHRLQASHSAYFSQPRELAGLIEGIAAA